MDDNFDMQFNSIPFSVHNGDKTKEKICLWQLTQAFKILVHSNLKIVLYHGVSDKRMKIIRSCLIFYFEDFSDY